MFTFFISEHSFGQGSSGEARPSAPTEAGSLEKPSATHAPFFIVGSGRSGTTLLRLILASHSRLSIPPETWFLDQMIDLLEVEGPLGPRDVDRAIRTITGHRRWGDLHLDADEFRSDVANMKDPTVRDVVEWPYLKYLARDGKERWGDKTPGYIEIVPQLVKLFPGAKFIELIRDGRDVARSYHALTFHGPWLHQNAKEWLDAMECSERLSHDPASRHMIQIYYEDLVLDSERTVRRICDFLGEEFEPEMLAWPKSLDDFIPERGKKKMHRNLKRMPEAADALRWKREMSPHEDFVCEAFMAKHLKAHGYELRYTGFLWESVFPLARWYYLYALPVVWFPRRAFRQIKRAIFGNRPVAENLPPAAESRDAS